MLEKGRRIIKINVQKIALLFIPIILFFSFLIFLNKIENEKNEKVESIIRDKIREFLIFKDKDLKLYVSKIKDIQFNKSFNSYIVTIEYGNIEIPFAIISSDQRYIGFFLSNIEKLSEYKYENKNRLEESVKKFFASLGIDLSLIKIKDIQFNKSFNSYIVTIEYGNIEIPFAIISSDQRYIGIIKGPLNFSTNVPRSNRPKIELFIWSYCPYGVQALRPFAKVAKLMKEYADFYVKFNGDYHGDYERQQNFIQACIIRLYPEKYWDYAIKFVDEIFSKCNGNITCDKEESIRIMRETGIDHIKILNCVEKNGSMYYEQDMFDIELYSIIDFAGGSPSFVINGIYVGNIIRTEEGIKNVVCQAFNNPPAICNQTLSTQVQNVPQGSC